MAEYRMIKTKIWRDKKFKEWDVFTKLLAWYLLTNEYVPPAGLYEIDIEVVRYSVGFNGPRFRRSFTRLEGDGWLMYDDSYNLIWIVNALRHQPSINQSVMVNVWESLRQAPLSFLVDKFKEKYATLLLKYDTLSTRWEQPVDTSSISDKIRLDKIKSDSKTPSPTKDIFNHWEKCYKDATGEKYPFFGDRDGKMFKGLSTKYGKDKVCSLIDEFFKQADEDPKCWWHDKLDVSVWYRQIPKLITQLTRGK